MSFVGGIIGKVDGDGTVNNSSTTVKGCTFSGSVKEIAKAEKASDAKAIEYRISASGAAGGIVGATGWSVPKGDGVTRLLRSKRAYLTENSM